MNNIFYEVSEKYNGTPVAYFKSKKQIKDFKQFNNSNIFEIEKTKNPSHLEFLITNQNDETTASFRNENFAEIFNMNYHFGKGYVTPNSK